MFEKNNNLKTWLDTGKYASEKNINEFLDNSNNELYIVTFSDDESNSSYSTEEEKSEITDGDISMASFVVEDDCDIDDDSLYVEWNKFSIGNDDSDF